MFSEKTIYSLLNEKAEKNGTVFVGSKYLKSLCLEELFLDSHMALPAYSRCFDGLNIDNIKSALEECVYPLKPHRLFINLGENDIDSPDFDLDSFKSKYEFLLLDVHRKCPEAKIYAVGIKDTGEKAVLLNKAVRDLSEENGCTFVALSRDLNLSLKDYSRLEKYIAGYREAEEQLDMELGYYSSPLLFAH